MIEAFFLPDLKINSVKVLPINSFKGQKCISTTEFIFNPTIIMGGAFLCRIRS